MSTVIPFPLARRRAYVLKQAVLLSGLGHAAAERWLASQLELQRRVMLRRGITASDAAKQLRSLEWAIRAEVVRLSRGGAA
jgi:hypothetical protein